MILNSTQRFLVGATFATLLVSALLGLQYLDSLGQKSDLSHRLASLQATVDRINSSTLSGQNQNSLVTTAAFPANPPNLDLASVILASSAASGVTTGSLAATTQGTEKVGANTYRTISTSVTVSGTLPQVLDFFDRVERGGIHTLVFDNIQADPTAGRWTVKLQVVAYAQPG